MTQLTFWGAAQEVTGSCYQIKTRHANVLIECGLIQGGREEEQRNREPFPFDVAAVDAVVLSHAHLDHSGRLPMLVKQGYTGPIFLTNASGEILEVILNDAAYLNQRDTEWENKRRRRAGKNEIEPLFSDQDVEQTLSQCDGMRYSARREIAKGVEVCFRDAGHILGSAIVELFIRDGENDRKLVFTGDLGNSCTALLRDPQVITEADVLLLESTYGDRDHQSLERTLAEFEEVFLAAAENGGNVLIPAFAVGRTQEIIFRLGELYQRGKLRHQAVFLDSPMGIAATEIYHRFQHVFDSADSEQLTRANVRSLHTFLPVLRYTRTTEESMAINRIEEGAIIIAGSGMCTGGRIRHHLKHNLWRRSAHIMIVGYQAIGTTGRKLVDGASHIRLFGEDVAVAARVHTLGGFSAHAGQSQLVEWAKHFDKPVPRLFLVHGETAKMQVLQSEFAAQLGWQAEVASTGQTVEF